MQEIQCKISGLVQGVFFRSYTKECADKLELTGYVKNLQDGSVEVVVQSYNEDLLKEFISKIKEGSPLSKVDSIDTRWSHPEKEFEHFTIEHE